jgi:hypothetical protein
MKILIIILDVLVIGWLFMMTPIVDSVVTRHASMRLAELAKAGVVNYDALVDFQKMNKNEFQGTGYPFAGRWLTQKHPHSGWLIAPAGVLLAVNGLFLAVLTIRRRKQKIKAEQSAAPLPPAPAGPSEGAR